jgi:hypothetical protein
MRIDIQSLSEQRERERRMNGVTSVVWGALCGMATWGGGGKENGTVENIVYTTDLPESLDKIGGREGGGGGGISKL